MLPPHSPHQDHTLPTSFPTFKLSHTLTPHHPKHISSHNPFLSLLTHCHRPQNDLSPFPSPLHLPLPLLLLLTSPSPHLTTPHPSSPPPNLHPLPLPYQGARNKDCNPNPNRHRRNLHRNRNPHRNPHRNRNGNGNGDPWDSHSRIPSRLYLTIQCGQGCGCGCGSQKPPLPLLHMSKRTSKVRINLSRFYNTHDRSRHMARQARFHEARQTGGQKMYDSQDSYESAASLSWETQLVAASRLGRHKQKCEGKRSRR